LENWASIITLTDTPFLQEAKRQGMLETIATNLVLARIYQEGFVASRVDSISLLDRIVEKTDRGAFLLDYLKVCVLFWLRIVFYRVNNIISYRTSLNNEGTRSRRNYPQQTGL
jgi:hypothetical protein